MSTIRLSGTTSGYYDLTVPAVAGTNSIDLSNLAVKDSNGNLGIGTASPQTTLDTGYTRIYNSGAASSPASGKGLELHYVTSGRTQGEGAYLVSYDRDNSVYKQFTVDANGINLSTAGLNRMIIDSSGRATKPYQPYFYAGGTTNGTATTTTIPFNSTDHNVGNHFNTSNYTFTAPVAGNYLFTCSILNYPSAASAGEIYFSVNGGGYSPLSRWNGIPGQASLTLSAIKKLSANDTVKVIGNLYYYITGGHGHFSGMLLG